SQRAMSAVGACVLVAQVALAPAQPVMAGGRQIDRELTSVLRSAGFTGRIEFTLQRRMRRRLNDGLTNIGQLLWFDTITGLNDDNTCAGCHSPTHGFGDTQSIAIGIENNGMVGPHR